MGVIDITLSEDLLQAYLSISDGNQPARAEIMRAIEETGIVFGINEVVIDDLVQQGASTEKVLVAQGLPPVAGKNAKLIWNIDIQHSFRPKISDSGQADFKKLSLYHHVDIDQVLVSKLPATVGTAGRTVTGEELVVPGKDVALPTGTNTYLSDDNLTLLAGKEGHVYWEAGKLKVDTILAVDSDVDYRTGNIQFDGSILIYGDVRTGFRVEATGSIFVGGTVEAATIYSENGDINIAAGILGRSKAKIFAGKNLACSFAQDATIGVHGDLTVDRYLINCNISAEGKITLGPEIGLIRGGKITSDASIRAKEIGTEKNISTEIIVGSQHNPKGSTAQWGFHEQRKLLESKLVAKNQRLQFIELLKSRLPSMTTDRAAELEIITAEVQTLNRQLQMLIKQESQLQTDWEQQHRNMMIQVKGQLHRNVYIEIGGVAMKTDREYCGVELSRLRDEIRINKLLTS